MISLGLDRATSPLLEVSAAACGCRYAQAYSNIRYDPYRTYDQGRRANLGEDLPQNPIDFSVKPHLASYSVTEGRETVR